MAKKWKAVTGKTPDRSRRRSPRRRHPSLRASLIRPTSDGSGGVPISSTEVAIRDDEGADLAVGIAGELCVGGPQVMKGYWNKPEETAKVMTPDGFLRTGDIATIDENGFVHIVHRKKDMINVSGFKVYPNEVQEIVSLHPGVLEVGAVGVPDPASGEAVKIVVVKRDPLLTVEDLKAHCRNYLTTYKIPRAVEFRRELPKTNLGKICGAPYETLLSLRQLARAILFNDRARSVSRPKR